MTEQQEHIIDLSIRIFSEKMYERMMNNLEEKGLSYKDEVCSIEYLCNCLRSKLNRLNYRIETRNLVDIANFCMMIVEKLEQDVDNDAYHNEMELVIT